MKRYLFIILSFLTTFNFTVASVENSSETFLPKFSPEKRELYRKIFFSHTPQLPSIDNPFEMEVTSEEVNNVPDLCQSTNIVQAPVVSFQFSKVNMDLHPDFPKDLLQHLKVKAGGGHKVLFPVHPCNKDEDVVGQKELNRLRSLGKPILSLPIRNLASRSKIGVPNHLSPFGIKLATNYINENTYQPTKASMRVDGLYGRARTTYMEKIDELIGVEEDCQFLKELGYINLKSTEEGYLIRDLRPLQDGNIYIPLFNIPYVGREIAEFRKESFEEFWGREFADAMGRCKAKHLLRYGLQMLTPNSQNMLKRFDQDLNPKEIIYRDSADTHFVTVVAEVISPLIDKHLGVVDGSYSSDKAWGNVTYDFIHPYSSNTTWMMDEGPHKFSTQTLDSWNERQIKSYLKTINEELGASIVPFAKNAPDVDAFDKRFCEGNKEKYKKFPDEDDLPYISAIQAFFESPEGKLKLQSYYQNLINKKINDDLILSKRKENSGKNCELPTARKTKRRRIQ